MAATAGKSAVRARLLAGRATLSAAARDEAARQVRAHLVAALGARPPRGGGTLLVAAYVPFGTEPGGADLPEALRAAGARVVLPVLREDNDLDWAAYGPPAELAETRRGLREPTGARLGVEAVTGAGLVVVPAVAVDRRGVRLGRGGGSYDRVLARVSAGVPTVALLHDGELIEEVPAEAHDQRVSAVITPSGGWCDLPYISRLGGRSGVR
jgi:5-formyltetrahydrofolate cyclo-ligase